METMTVTKKEKELIETLRNYRRAYPNGSHFLGIEIDELVDELKSPDEE